MKMKTNTKRLHGFSLVELMVVIAIIGLLATVVTVNVIGQAEKAKFTRVKADMDGIKKALKLFRLDMGRYPNSLDELVNAPGGAGRKWTGPYLDDLPSDPWDNPYEFQAGSGRANDFEITSYGADGAPGGVEINEDLSSKTIFSSESN